MTVGQLKEILEDYHDGLEVSIVVPTEDGSDEDTYHEFNTDYFMGKFVITVEND